MSWFANLVGSTIGKKLIMALTGLLIFGFTVGHMAGNLQLFVSADMFNGYAFSLKSNVPLLWGTRIALLTAFPLHIWSAISLSRANAAARPSSYGAWAPQRSTLMSRTMKFGGFVLLAFVVYHILHFTVTPVWGFGIEDGFSTTIKGETAHDAHAMVLSGFSGVMGFVNVGFYLLAVAALFLHLYHGVWSATQTLGINHKDWVKVRKTVAAGFALVVCGGFALVPILTSTGVTEMLNDAIASVQVDSTSATAMNQEPTQ